MIAIDGMGGDRAPNVIAKGISLFHARFPDEEFIVYGDESVLRPLFKGDVQSKVRIVHTDEAISSDAKVSGAIRLKRSSMRLALEAVASGEANCVVSAGNTGAYMALSKMILKTLPGISRPAIASQIPSLNGESVMLDLGGSVGCTAKNLIDYAIMGEIFARCVLGVASPSVGLLNVGVEEAKGGEHLQEAHSYLKHRFSNFYGFIEGTDITRGTVDVIVTDGFTGNVALKTGEGMMKLMMTSLKRSFSRSLRGKIAYAIAKPFFKEIKEYFDPRRYNGAMWLGLNGTAVKSHGGTDSLGFAYAIEMAHDIVQADINASIMKALCDMQYDMQYKKAC